MSTAPTTLDDLTAKLDRLVAELQRRHELQPRFFGLRAAEAYSGLSLNSLRSLIDSGKLTALRPLRGKILLDRLEVDSFILTSTGRPRTGRGNFVRS